MRRIVFSGEYDHSDDDEDEGDCFDKLGQDDNNCDEVMMTRMRIRMHNGFVAWTSLRILNVNRGLFPKSVNPFSQKLQSVKGQRGPNPQRSF